MDADDEETDTAPPAIHSPSQDEDFDMLGVAADLDSQTGLQSPPSKRVKLSESPSPPYEFLDENEEGSSEAGSGSEDSFLLDIFHAENAAKFIPGIINSLLHR